MNSEVCRRSGTSGENDETCLQSRAMEAVLRVERMRHSALDSQITKLGIRRLNHFILMHLSETEKCSSQKEIADRMHVTAAAVTGAIKELERDGYIEKRQGSDSRFKEIRITEKGLEARRRSHEFFTMLDEAQFEGFSDGELEELVAFMTRIKTNLEAFSEKEKKKEEKREL